MPHVSYAEAYLSKYRFYLRGYPDDLIDERVEEIREFIRDAVDEKDAYAPHPLGRDFVDEKSRRWQNEKRIVENMVSPKYLADATRREIQRKQASDHLETLVDLATIAAGLFLACTATSGPSHISTLRISLALATILGGVLGFALRVLPIGHSATRAKPVFALVRAGRFATVIAAVGQGISSAVTLTAAIHRDAAGWSANLSLSHVPASLVAAVAAVLLGMKPSMLLRYETSLKRCASLDDYRNSIYLAWTPAAERRRRDRSYFTEHIL